MSGQERFVYGCALVFALALVGVQVYDNIVWSTSNWLGVTVYNWGRIGHRGVDEVPEPLRVLLSPKGLFAISVETDRRIDLTGPDVRPRIAYDSLRRALAEVEVGSLVTLRVLTAEGEVHDVPLTVQRLPGDFVLKRAVVYPTIGILFAVVGFVVFQLAPDRRQAKVFLAATLLIALEQILGQVLGGPPNRFLLLSSLLRFATPAALAVMVLGVGPQGWLRRRPWVYGLPWLGVAIALFVDMLDGLVVTDLVGATSGGDGELVLNACRFLFFPTSLVYLIWARFHAENRQEARRVDLYFLGLVLPIGTVFTTHVLLPTMLGMAPPPLGNLAMLAFPLAIGYGIVKHRLFDIEVVFRRALGYGAVTALGVLVYGALVAGGGVLLGGTRAAGSPALTAAFVVLAVGVGSYARPLLQRLVDRGVNPERFRYLEALRVASAELAGLEGEAAFAERLAAVATETAGLAAAAVYVRHPGGYVLLGKGGAVGAAVGSTLGDEEPLIQLAGLVGAEIHRDDFDVNPRLRPLRDDCVERMHELGATVLLPVRAGKKRPIALLALGPHQDGRPLNSEDLDLLKTLASQAALGILHAQRAPADASDAPTAVDGSSPADTIAHYRLEERCGSGGMGTVYRAVDDRLGRTVALKFLRDDLAESDQMLQRLRREARILATLNHPNIMQIHALEEERGRTFLAMEFIAGHTLSAELRDRGQLPPRAAIEAVATVAAALDYALTKGVIHRDLKLGNLMRTDGGEIKITDFGLAKPLEGEQSLTAAQGVVGTLAYLAPELLTGAPASFRSDMYSLGVCLLRLVTGAPSSERRGERLPRSVGEDELRARGVPAAITALLARPLADDPEDRYPDYVTLIADLQRAAERLVA